MRRGSIRFGLALLALGGLCALPPAFGQFPGSGKKGFGGGARFGGAALSMSPGADSAPPGFMGMGRRDPYEMMNRMADDEFRRRDINGDGFLNLDEMPDGIKNELARWDINRDGLIDM